MAAIATEGSEYWRNLFLALAGIWILFSIFRGWIQGILRQLVPLAILGASLAVVLLVPAVSGFFHDRTRLSGPISTIALGAGAWLFVYSLLLFAGGIIFKRTRDQDFAVLRLFFGLGGAAIALVYALLQNWIFVIAIRVFGRVAEDQIAIQSSRNAVPGGWVIGLARLKNSLELAPGRAVLDQLDPVPSKVYLYLDQWSQLLASPRALARLLEFPGFRSVWENPNVRVLQTDPELLEAVRRSDFLAVISNPKVITLWSDPNIRALLTGDQIQAACDYANQEAKR
jgi:hypothetical protein